MSRPGTRSPKAERRDEVQLACAGHPALVYRKRRLPAASGISFLRFKELVGGEEKRVASFDLSFRGSIQLNTKQ